MEFGKRGLLIGIFVLLIFFVVAVDEETAIYGLGDNETSSGVGVADNSSFFVFSDATSPVITLVSPSASSSSSSTSQNFTFSVSDTSGIQSCSLILDGTAVSSSSSISKTSSNGFYVTSLSVASHTWQINCTDTSGNTGSSSQRAISIVSSSSVIESSSQQGGGGGGGGGMPAPSSGISLDVENINIRLILNTSSVRSVNVINNGNSERRISISTSGLEGLAIFDSTSFSLSSGESREVQFVFVSPEHTGIYTGKIFISGVEIPVSLNVATKELLFDTLLSVADSDKHISPGDFLNAQVTLIPMGEEPRVDVTLTYIIKDYEGKIHFSESETVLVEGQKDFRKQFNTKNIPVGKYILGVELVYINGVATASSHFEIESKAQKIFFSFYPFAIVFAILLTVGIIFYLIKYKKPKRLIRRE
jgi:hypothetical protein